jgi:hypothetical protein
VTFVERMATGTVCRCEDCGRVTQETRRKAAGGQENIRVLFFWKKYLLFSCACSPALSCSPAAAPESSLRFHIGKFTGDAARRCPEL